MATISGTVSKGGDPLGGAYVRLIGPSGEFTAEIYTRDDGRFTFHVVDGEWTLEARAAGAQSRTKSVGVEGSDETVFLDLT